MVQTLTEGSVLENDTFNLWLHRISSHVVYYICIKTKGV